MVGCLLIFGVSFLQRLEAECQDWPKLASFADLNFPEYGPLTPGLTQPAFAPGWKGVAILNIVAALFLAV